MAACFDERRADIQSIAFVEYMTVRTSRLSARKSMNSA
jgi:hypothetical protein